MRKLLTRLEVKAAQGLYFLVEVLRWAAGLHAVALGVVLLLLGAHGDGGVEVVDAQRSPVTLTARSSVTFVRKTACRNGSAH